MLDEAVKSNSFFNTLLCFTQSNMSWIFFKAFLKFCTAYKLFDKVIDISIIWPKCKLTTECMQSRSSNQLSH